VDAGQCPLSADCVEKLRQPLLPVIFESATRGQRNDDFREERGGEISLRENRFEVIVDEFFNIG
jgi:hypothetical protein